MHIILTKHWQKVSIILVIFLSIVLRFANYQNRWTLQQDQSRDAVIALYSIKQGTIPLLGPPSSAGQFSFGPVYYWVIILFTLILPNLINGPWVGFTVLSVVSVIIFYEIGKKISGQSFGIILALLAAIAPLDVFNAPDMLNPMLVSVATVLFFLSLVQVIEKKKIIYSALAGFAVGLAINFHLQSLVLLPPLVGIIVINKYNFRQRMILTLGILFGMFLSFSPLIYFDMTHHGIWLKSIYEFLREGQNKFIAQEPILAEINNIWIALWGEVITGFPTAGYFLIAVFGIAAVLAYKKKIKLATSSVIIIVSLFIQIVLLVFYKGPRMPIYLIVFHPFVIFITGWSLWVIWKFKNALGLTLILVIVSISLYSDWGIINSPSQTPLVFSIKQKVETAVNGDKTVYNFAESNTISLPLFYLWLKEGKISDQGHKIGVCKFAYLRNPATYEDIATCPVESKIIVSEQDYKVIDLDSASSDELNKLDKLNSKKIYNWIYSNYLK